MKKLDLDDKFTRVIFRKYKIPRQGWKIHISSFLEDYDSVLKIVKRFCHDNYITFKYFSSKELYQENISNNANPAEAGKLITIYPYDVEMAYNVMLDLSKLLSNFSGPCVLSDYQFQNSKNIFFRYGINIYTSEKKKGKKSIRWLTLATLLLPGFSAWYSCLNSDLRNNN